MNRKVCVITGTRAEYGLLKLLMRRINAEQTLDLQLIVTGMHLSPEFGLTYQEIETDGFSIDKKIEILMSSDSSVGIAKAMGLGLIGFADAYAELKPDIVIILGDRFEMLAAASAALAARIPIAHLHGGEATEGLIDEAIRHSITKMSHLHFVAAEVYRKRVIQLGEDPQRVFLVGAMGIDAIAHMQLLSRKDLEASLGFQFAERNLLVTFHPVTLEANSAASQMEELLAALAELRDIRIIFTLPNADADGRTLINKIECFITNNSNAVAYPSLGQLRYLSCLAQVDGVVGNSSSGLIEAPSFNVGTVNIGARQDGRLSAPSVINCEPERREIGAAIDKLFSADFCTALAKVNNPYGEPGATEKIVSVIKYISMSGILKKRFYDHPCA
jgi:GDP/UDP-N,N'-diacetylbacillosamine 2-epimerase (hydrolysing)